MSDEYEVGDDPDEDMAVMYESAEADLAEARDELAAVKAERDLARSQLETAVGALEQVAHNWACVGGCTRLNCEHAIAVAALATIQQPQGSR